MGKKKHQFIDKKKAHKFNVVYRSQRDPLQPDDESSQHVLVPAGGGMPDNAGASGSTSSCQEEKVKYGIYYDDDYDYLQHLRPRGEGMLIMAEESTPTPRDDNFGILNLPSEAFPSKYEEDIGMLNKGVLPRGPQPDWDPDIVACLDDDIDLDDPDNILEDDFIKMANDECYDESRNDEMTKDDGDWETESDVSSTGNLGSDDLSDIDDSEEETKSRFTNYSMTSSVIRRTEGLKILDDRFEHIMEEYDEEEIGPIDHEEMAGTFDINNDLMADIVEEFIQEHTKIPFSETVNEEDADVDESSSDENNEDDDKLFEEFEKKDGQNWDCESIISTYSNIYNHPKLIDEPKVIKLHSKSGIPLGVLKDNKQNDDTKIIDTKANLIEPIVLNNVRNKCETSEEKKARKQEVKKYRKDRRKEKKDTKLFFHDEHRKQEKISLNKSNLIAIQ